MLEAMLDSLSSTNDIDLTSVNYIVQRTDPTYQHVGPFPKAQDNVVSQVPIYWKNSCADTVFGTNQFVEERHNQGAIADSNTDQNLRWFINRTAPVVVGPPARFRGEFGLDLLNFKLAGQPLTTNPAGVDRHRIQLPTDVVSARDSSFGFSTFVMVQSPDLTRLDLVTEVYRLGADREPILHREDENGVPLVTSERISTFNPPSIVHGLNIDAMCIICAHSEKNRAIGAILMMNVDNPQVRKTIRVDEHLVVFDYMRWLLLGHSVPNLYDRLTAVSEEFITTRLFDVVQDEVERRRLYTEHAKFVIDSQMELVGHPDAFDIVGIEAVEARDVDQEDSEPEGTTGFYDLTFEEGGEDEVASQQLDVLPEVPKSVTNIINDLEVELGKRYEDPMYTLLEESKSSISTSNYK